tara:strand:+ start:211 stop:408 length:198 start_codon:yes stop_codon:yes gene_type:complete
MGQGNFEWPDVNPANVAISKGMRVITIALYIIIVILLLSLIPKEKTETENQPGELFNNAPTEQNT